LLLVASDVSAAMLAQLRADDHGHALGAVLSAAEQLPLRTASLDLVTAFNCVHHFDLGRFLTAVARVLAPGGQLFVYTRNPAAERADDLGPLLPRFRRARAAPAQRGRAPGRGPADRRADGGRHTDLQVSALEHGRAAQGRHAERLGERSSRTFPTTQRDAVNDGSVALFERGGRETGVVMSSGTSSVFACFRFPREVIAVAVRWYPRNGLGYRDVEELLAERGVAVDHVTVYRWVQRFTPEFIEAARLRRHAPGDRWFADETYVRVAGRWAYLYRAIDQHGQVIDVLLSGWRDLAAARRFFTRALRVGTIPAEVTTDRAPAYPRVLDELIPSALHTAERYANNPV
jgi:transposase, IS6 family